MEFAERLDEFNSVPTEPISVGDNNFLDISRVDAFQKGLKVLAFVVESQTDVFQSRVVQITSLEGCHLLLEVFGVFGRADSCIDDKLFLALLETGVAFKWCLDIGDVVDSLSTDSAITESSYSDSARVSQRCEC